MKIILTILFCFICSTAWATTVTYYFNAYDSGGEEWANLPGNMVDGSEVNYAYTPTADEVQLNTGNTCDGTDLGTITKVELRFKAGDFTDTTTMEFSITPVFGGDTDGDGTYKADGFTDSLSWSSYFDITNDGNAPGTWGWSDIQNLDCDIFISSTPGGANGAISKVEIRVTYSGVTTVTPDAIPLTLSLQTPSASGEAVTTPDTLPLTLTLQSPAVGNYVTITPDALPLTLSLETPAISGEAIISPSALPLTLSLHSPVVSDYETVTPDALSLTLTLQSSTISGEAITIPDVLSLTSTLQSPVVSGEAITSPSVLPLTLTLQTPSASGEAVTTPDVIPITLTLQAPSVVIIARTKLQGCTLEGGTFN